MEEGTDKEDHRAGRQSAVAHLHHRQVQVPVTEPSCQSAGVSQPK